ncbi:MAG TPA: hypothetical protein PKO19_07445, partial [Chitinophagales bacterium]|nr:hypothetical protein [Chitinophagales bacterium]
MRTFYPKFLFIVTFLGLTVFAEGQGYVGIGTTTPAEKLDVSGGDARINTLTVGLGKNGLYANTVLGMSALQSTTTGN